MDTAGVAEVVLLPAALPGVRGIGVLRRVFTGQVAAQSGHYAQDDGTQFLGTPHAFFRTPGHVFISVDGGEGLVAFDKVNAEVRHGMDDLTLGSAMVEQLNDKECRLQHGLLAYKSDDPIVLVAPEDAMDDAKPFYFVHASGKVRTARFVREAGQWHWAPGADFQLGRRNDGDVITVARYSAERYSFVWVAVGGTGLHSVHVQSMLGPTVGGSVDDSFTQHVMVMCNAPPCDVHLSGDTVTMSPVNADVRAQELYLFQLGRLALSVLRVGVGVLPLGDGAVVTGATAPRAAAAAAGGAAARAGGAGRGGKLAPVDFRAVHRRVVLPAWLRDSKKGVSPATVVAVHPRDTHRDLLVLTTDGVVTCVRVDGPAVAMRPLCTLAGLDTDRLGSHPQLFALQCYIGVVGVQETLLFRTLDGRQGRRPLSGRFNEFAWTASYGRYQKCGLWSPTGGLWEVRCHPVLDQAKALSADCADDDALQGEALAALLCDTWGLPRASGLHAVNALVHLSSLSPANDLVPDAASSDGNITAARVRQLLPYIRAVARSPALLIATLHRQPCLRRLLDEEMELYTQDADATTYMGQMQAPSSGLTVTDLVKRYRLASDRFGRVLEGAAAGETAVPEPVGEKEEGEVQARIHTLLTERTSTDDGAGPSLQHFMTTAPRAVLQCALELLRLPDALDNGFPPPEEFRANRANGIVVNALQSTAAVLNDSLGPSAVPALDDQSVSSQSLFEVVVRLMVEICPSRVEEFVCFAVDVCGDNRQDTFLRGVRALPTVAGPVSDDAARVRSALHANAGDPCTAIDLLAANLLWGDAIALTERLADGGMMHVKVFKLMLKRMLEAGAFPSRGLALLQNARLAPPTFSAGDLFELFAEVQPAAAPSSLCRREGDVSVGSIRDYLIAMIKEQRPRDLQPADQALAAERSS